MSGLIVAIAVAFVVVSGGFLLSSDTQNPVLNGKTVENAVYIAASKVPINRKSFILIEKEVVSIIRSKDTKSSWVYRALVRVNMRNCWNKNDVTGVQILVLTCEKGVDVTDYRSWVAVGQRYWDVPERRTGAGQSDAPKQFVL
jgi:hypothetical protein